MQPRKQGRCDLATKARRVSKEEKKGKSTKEKNQASQGFCLAN